MPGPWENLPPLPRLPPPPAPKRLPAAYAMLIIIGCAYASWILVALIIGAITGETYP